MKIMVRLHFEGAQCESREESLRGEVISLCDQDDPYREVLHKLYPEYFDAVYQAPH